MRTDMTAADLGAAWRLAYVATRDRAAATAAFDAARAEPEAGEMVLLAGTWSWARIRSASSAPPVGSDSPGSLDAAFWNLGPEQRGALWLTEVEGLSPPASASVLGTDPGRAVYLLEQARQGTVTVPPGPGCPPTARLGQYVVGDLPAADAAAVDDHVLRCATCRARSAQIEGNPELGSALEAMVPGAPIDLGRASAPDGSPGDDPRFAAFFGAGLAAGDANPTGEMPAVARSRRGRRVWLAAISLGVLAAAIAGVVAIHSKPSASHLRDGPAGRSAPVHSSLTLNTIAPSAPMVPVPMSTATSASTTTTSSSTTTTVPSSTTTLPSSTTTVPASVIPVPVSTTTAPQPTVTVPSTPTGTTTTTTTTRPAPPVTVVPPTTTSTTARTLLPPLG